jgi:hypothetical protein
MAKLTLSGGNPLASLRLGGWYRVAPKEMSAKPRRISVKLLETGGDEGCSEDEGRPLVRHQAGGDVEDHVDEPGHRGQEARLDEGYSQLLLDG